MIESKWVIPVHAEKWGSCIHRLGLDICFDEYSWATVIPSRRVSWRKFAIVLPQS